MKLLTRKTIRFFLSHIKRYKVLFAGMLISITIAVTVSMAVPLLWREMINTLVGEGTKVEIAKELIMIVVYIFLLNFADLIFWRISALTNNFFQPKIMSNIMNECFEKLHYHSYSFFNNNFSGALVKKIHRIVNAFESIMDRLYWDMFPLTIRVAIAAAVLTYLHPILGIITLSWTVIFIALSYFISKFKIKYDIARAKADTRVTARLADTITNSTNIKLFSNLKFERTTFGKITKYWFRKTKRAWDIDAIIEAVQGLLMGLLEFAILFTAVKLWQRDLLTVGDFGLIQLYMLEIFMHIWNLGRIIRDLYRYFADAEEMTKILNTPCEVKDEPNAKKLIVQHGKVEFKNISFSYENASAIIKGLSFKVNPSSKIALIGPSGGGKTTIAKLLLRLFNLNKGQILIDGQNIAKVTQESLRQAVALVPQDPILFHRTLMENIRYGRQDASDEEVIAASKLAHCHEFIKKFPKKYHTYVGERGVKLSGGERQRVAIARAILSNTNILILDEATSQLDSQSEKLIQDALKNLMKNKTTFIIAHRLSTIMETDRVLVLKEGEIIEDGQHASLVNRKGSLYKKLWDLQVGGYLES